MAFLTRPSHILGPAQGVHNPVCVSPLESGMFYVYKESVNHNTMMQDLRTNYELIRGRLCAATAQATHLSSLHSAAPRLSQLLHHPETCGPSSGINQSQVCAAQPASC